MKFAFYGSDYIGTVMQIIKHVAISIKQKVKPALAQPNYFAFGFLGLWFGLIPIFCLGLATQN